MKTAVVTDSTCYLPEEVVRKHHITVVPIPFVLDGVAYNEGVDITTAEFYEKLKHSKTLPSTSQPPLGEMLKIYEDLGNQGYDNIISIHLAGTISGLVDTLRTAVKSVTNTHVYVFDSHYTVLLMGTMVLKAAEMAEAGDDPEKIIATLTRLRDTADCYFVVDDLKNLVKGGRLSNAAGFIGGLLQIKPLLTFNQEDKIVAIEKIRSLKRAYNRVEQLFDEKVKTFDYPIRCYVISDEHDTAIAFRDRMQAKYPNLPFEVGYFGPVIGSHLGAKALGFGWMEDYQKI